jgi:hypothetical protein
MTTEITGLTLGRMEYCDVQNHGKTKRFQGTGSVELSLVERNVHLSIWVLGSTQEENTIIGIDLDKKALTAMIGQLQTMKTVLIERLEEWNAA